MSRLRKQQNQSIENPDIGKKFRIFVKPIDELGFPDESRFGWVSYTKDKTIDTTSTWERAIIFEEKENGHGSFDDWKRFFLEEHKDWRITNGPFYLSSEEQQ